MPKHPKNLMIISEPRLDVIAHRLRRARTGVHFTNGTYRDPASLIVPTTIGGFRFIAERVAKRHEAFAMAINSDVSMRNADIDTDENQRLRAEKVLIPLARTFPDRQVFGVHYHQETPEQLYAELKRQGMPPESLHKWGGYGIDGGPIIVGADHAKRVLAFPFESASDRPAFWDITPKGDQTQKVEVVDLYQARSRRGAAKPIIS
ncbi:MAG: hypothetical protein AAF569_06915 [Pseudomonadota bacterium]